MIKREGTYKYLDVNGYDGIQLASMKEKVRKEYYRRKRMILKSELNSASKI